MDVYILRGHCVVVVNGEIIGHLTKQQHARYQRQQKLRKAQREDDIKLLLDENKRACV